MTISARLVRFPRKTYRCDGCRKPIDGAHVYAYGHAEDYTPPFGIRLHIACCGETKDAKILAAAKKATQ